MQPSFVSFNFETHITQTPKKTSWRLMLIILTVFFFNGIPNAKGDFFSNTKPSSNIKYNDENKDRIYLSKKNVHHAYDKIVMKAARRHEVHPALIKAIIMAESSYNPKAVSKMGARGLMQLMPDTARAMGVKNSFNPSQNIHGGTKYFKYLLTEFQGNIRMALAAYNAGMFRVKKYGRIPPFKATQNYVRKVMAYYREYVSEMRMMAKS